MRNRVKGLSKRAGIFLLAAVCATAIMAVSGCFKHFIKVPAQRDFIEPAATKWAPAGPRKAGNYGYDIIPKPDSFHTMHVGINNTDNLWIAAAPMIEYDWIAETDMYIAEGPTFDNEGGLYFTPLNPKEDVSLVCLDRLTGERKWSVPGRGAAHGAVLILNDPDHPGKQIVYHGTYETTMALRPDGSVIWEEPTGLKKPEIEPGEKDLTHTWGLNYHPQTDSIIGVTINGYVYAHSRKTGEKRTQNIFRLPGAPAIISFRPAQKIQDIANKELEAVFGTLASDVGWFTAITDVIFGNGFQVANYYAVDPNTGRIYISATAPDDQDGALDGVSQNGALYLLELVDGSGGLEFKIIRYYAFEGGTGSTPTVSPNGDRVMVSDDNGNVIALDNDLNELWRIDVGEKVAASVAVSVDNNEVYAVTRSDIFKLIDHGDRAEIAWRADLDAFPGHENFNTLTPTIAANGIAVSVGGGIIMSGQQLMMKVGIGLLDRDTGKLRYFAEGREESISVTSIGPDGGYYIASSPLRRAAARGIMGDKIPPITGGIQRYKPVRLDLLIRDAACAAHARGLNAESISAQYPKSAHQDILQIETLIKQCQEALTLAVSRGEMNSNRAKEISSLLERAQVDLSANDLSSADESLSQTCKIFD